MDPLTLGLVASAVTTAYSASKKPSAAAAQQSAVTPPQPTKTPTAPSLLGDLTGKGQAGGTPGIAQTFLSGAGGVDPSLLNLGKSTLLGGP